MNQTIAISAFAGMLARHSGYTADFCERFVHEMFKTVAYAIKDSTDVTIKGLGTFSVTADGNVAFTPDASFAADINAPFECFEPEVLSDGITDEQLLNGETDDTPSPQHIDDNDTPEVSHAPSASQEVVQETPANEQNDIQADEHEETAADEQSVITADEHEETTTPAPQEADATSSPSHSVNESHEAEPAACASDIPTEPASSLEANDNAPAELPTESCYGHATRRRPVWTFLAGALIGAIAGAGATYFILAPRSNEVTAVATTATQEATTAAPIANDSIAPPTATDSIQATAPANSAAKNEHDSTSAQAEVYDTITSTLAQLSRKHYGSYEFWVYIYEENKDIIANPDLIESNTRVRIPRPEKYGIDCHDRNSINNALKKSQEIASQRKK